MHANTRGQDIGRGGTLLGGIEVVDALVQAFHIQILRLGRLVDRLVVHGEVVHDRLVVLAVHALDTAGYQVCNLEAEGRVIRNDRRVGGCQDRGVAIHVLQALTGQGGAAGGSTDDKAAAHLVAGGPEGIASALEAEHRVEDVQRDHGLALGGIRGSGGGKGCCRTGLRNALVHNLAIGGLAVGQH